MSLVEIYVPLTSSSTFSSFFLVGQVKQYFAPLGGCVSVKTSQFLGFQVEVEVSRGWSSRIWSGGGESE